MRTKERFLRTKITGDWQKKRRDLNERELFVLHQIELNYAYMNMTIDGVYLNAGEGFVNFTQLSKKTKIPKTSLIRTNQKLVTLGFLTPIRRMSKKCGPNNRVLVQDVVQSKIQIYQVNSIVGNDANENVVQDVDHFYLDKLSGVVLSEFGYQWELKYSPEKFDSSANFNIQTAIAVSQEMKNLYGEEPDTEHVRMVINAYMWTNTKQLVKLKHPLGGLKIRLKSIMGKFKEPRTVSTNKA